MSIRKTIYELDFINSAQQLFQIIEYYKKQISPKGKIYLFIDEVQTITDWEKLITSLSANHRQDFEIFLSGSNSSLLSLDVARCSVASFTLAR